MNSNRRDEKSTIGVIVFVMFLIIMSLAFTVFITIKKDQKIISLPQVNVSILSDDGTEASNVSATFSIKTSDKKLQNTAKDVISTDVVEAMENVDYETLNKDGVDSDYVKSVVKESLSKKYGSEAIEEIYVTDFINDVKIPSKNDQDNANNNNVSKTMKGLFKNMN